MSSKHLDVQAKLRQIKGALDGISKELTWRDRPHSNEAGSKDFSEIEESVRAIQEELEQKGHQVIQTYLNMTRKESGDLQIKFETYHQREEKYFRTVNDPFTCRISNLPDDISVELERNEKVRLKLFQGE